MILLSVVIIFQTLYEFFKLDSEQFRYYMIGLFFYGTTALFFFLRFIVFPPLSDFENVISGIGVGMTPPIGLFYFIKGTESLAKSENPEFSRNIALHNLVLFLIIIMIIIIGWFVGWPTILYLCGNLSPIAFLIVQTSGNKF